MRAVGFMVMLIGASGIDAPNPVANYVVCIVGIVMMWIGNRKGQSQQ